MDYELASLIRIELKSSQKIVELLQEDIKLISHNLTSQSDGSYTQPEEHSTKLENNEGWSVARTKRQKENLNPHQYKIQFLLNRFMTPVEKIPNTT
jgi:hypothetical protein